MSDRAGVSGSPDETALVELVAAATEYEEVVRLIRAYPGHEEYVESERTELEARFDDADMRLADALAGVGEHRPTGSRARLSEQLAISRKALDSVGNNDWTPLAAALSMLVVTVEDTLVGEHRPDQPQKPLDGAASGALKELVDAAGPVVTEFSTASREERWPAVKRSDLARLEQALSKASRSAVREQEA